MATPSNYREPGAIQLRFDGESGKVHIIEGSSDLVHWEQIGVASPIGTGSLEFLNSEAGLFPQRYYRIASP